MREELILVDAREGGELIQEKIAKWQMDNYSGGNPERDSEILPAGDLKGTAQKDRSQENGRKRDESSSAKRTRPRRGGKRDLRELARSLGLGDPGSKRS